LDNLINDNYKKRISEIDEKIMEIRKSRNEKSDKCKLIEVVQEECKSLIEEIHTSC
jgi:hypothetical protein